MAVGPPFLLGFRRLGPSFNLPASGLSGFLSGWRARDNWPQTGVIRVAEGLSKLLPRSLVRKGTRGTWNKPFSKLIEGRHPRLPSPRPVMALHFGHAF